MHRVYLGLGSNLSDGRKNLNRAIELLAERVGTVEAVASYMESEPWGFESEHKFTNSAVRMLTELEPIALLDVTQEIEREMGRKEKHESGGAYKDRIIDIDILLYDDLSIQTERLTVPHPLIGKRDFVKIPLEEIKS